VEEGKRGKERKKERERKREREKERKRKRERERERKREKPEQYHQPHQRRGEERNQREGGICLRLPYKPGWISLRCCRWLSAQSLFLLSRTAFPS